MDRLEANGTILLIGGSETTATLLSGITYLLLQNPEVLTRLTEEVRSSFQSEKEITMDSVNNLSYMLACLNEALRSYPPIPIGLPRVVPKSGRQIMGQYVAADVNFLFPPFHENGQLRRGRPLLPSITGQPTTTRNTSPTHLVFIPNGFLAMSDLLTTSSIFYNRSISALGIALDGSGCPYRQPFFCFPHADDGLFSLAYAEMRLILARLIYNFDLKLADDSAGWMERQNIFFLWNKPPLHVFLTPVNRS